MAGFCEALVTAVETTDTVTDALEVFLAAEPEDFIPLLPEDRREQAEQLVAAAKLAVKSEAFAESILNQFLPESEDSLADVVKALCN